VLFDVLGVDDFGPRAAFDQLLQFLFALDQRDSSHNNLLDERDSKERARWLNLETHPELRNS
jgi:hypothetical protein